MAAEPSESDAPPVHLPENVIFNILGRLPVNSIFRCTSVCKPWNVLIKSPFFVSSYVFSSFSSHREDATQNILLQLCSRPVVSGSECFSLRLDDKELSEVSQIHFPYRAIFGFQAISSCHGLLLLVSGNFSIAPSKLMLWNPTISKSLMIESEKSFVQLEAIGLGFCRTTGDYKVLTIVQVGQNQRSMKVELYSLLANSWKRIPNVHATAHRNRSIRRGMTAIHGALHFVALREFTDDPKCFVLGFDLEAEVFSEFKLPECIAKDPGSRESWVWKYEEQLAVLWLGDVVDNVSQLELWVMKEYGVDDSWAHLSTIKLQDYPTPLFCNGLVYRSNGNVLLSLSSDDGFKLSSSDIFSHNLVSHETEYIGYFNGKPVCFFLDGFLESLILADKGNDLEKHFKTASCNPKDLTLISSSSYSVSSSDGDVMSSTVAGFRNLSLGTHSREKEIVYVQEDSDESDASSHHS